MLVHACVYETNQFLETKWPMKSWKGAYLISHQRFTIKIKLLDGQKFKIVENTKFGEDMV